MPVLFNEDDHFDFDKPVNNMLIAAVSCAFRGFLDPARVITTTATNARPSTGRSTRPAKRLSADY